MAAIKSSSPSLTVAPEFTKDDKVENVLSALNAFLENEGKKAEEERLAAEAAANMSRKNLRAAEEERLAAEAAAKAAEDKHIETVIRLQNWKEESEAAERAVAEPFLAAENQDCIAAENQETKERGQMEDMDKSSENTTIDISRHCISCELAEEAPSKSEDKVIEAAPVAEKQKSEEETKAQVPKTRRLSAQEVAIFMGVDEVDEFPRRRGSKGKARSCSIEDVDLDGPRLLRCLGF